MLNAGCCSANTSSADIDRLVELAIVAGEMEGGTSMQVLMAQQPELVHRLAFIPRPKRVKPRTWSQTELDILVQDTGILSDLEISERLGRSLNAMHVVRVRQHLPTPSRRPDTICAHLAGKLLGIDPHKVINWIKTGLLPGGPAPNLDRSILIIKRVDLVRWALDPMNWIWFEPGKVADAHLQRLLDLRQKLWGDEWWTTRQVADYHGVEVGDVKRYLQLGRIHGVRAPNRGGRDPEPKWSNWFIRRSEAMRVKFVHGKRKDDMAENKGLYGKYRIEKADGSAVDPKAIYFTLRIDTDPHARAAIRAYIESCREENPDLARDLEKLLEEIEKSN